MFNNKFLKHDPLLEAVKSAQMEGEYRRQAEAIVNEEFGVYSRKAVIRENLAAYDAALEETYKCMKEGDVENIMNPNSNWAKKQAADKSNPFNEPTPDPTKVAPNIMMKGAGGDGTRSMVDKVKSLFKEGKPNDGNLANNYPPYDKVTRGDVVAGALGKDQMGGKKKKMEEEQIDEMRDRPKKDDVNRRKRDAVAMKLGHNNPEGRNNNYNAPVSMLKHGRKLMKQGVTREETDYSAQDRAPVTKSAPKEDPSTPKSYPGAASSLTAGNPTSQRMSNAKAAVSPIKEAAYSAKAARAGKDIGKPGKNFEKIAKKAGEKYGSKERGEKVAGAVLKAIRAKHVKEDSSFNSAQITGKSVVSEAGVNPDSWAGSTFGSFKVPGTNYGGAPTQRQQADTSMKGVMGRLRTAKPSYAATHPDAKGAPPVIAPKAAAPKVAAPVAKGGKTVVSKADLETYRQNVGNKNATLGQYMNDLKGKTAIAGGKNDPARIQKTLGTGQKAFDPTTSTGEYGGPKSTATAAAAPKPATATPAAAPAPTKALQNPDQERTKQVAPLPSMATPSQGASTDTQSGYDKMKAMPTSNPSGATGSVTTKDSSLAPKKQSSMVAEEFVSVGENKYRIV